MWERDSEGLGMRVPAWERDGEGERDCLLLWENLHGRVRKCVGEGQTGRKMHLGWEVQHER